MDKIVTYLEENSQRFLDELKAFLRIPSISTDPNCRPHMREAAEFVARQLRQAGATAVEVCPTGGHPVVFAERIQDPGLPTVLVYGHYDVQPVDPVELWESGPFEPSIRNGRIYARGATDDKGQMMIHFKSLEAFSQVAGGPPVNLKFLVEGEEEIGSPNLNSFIEANLGRLACDVVAISDTAMFAPGIPSICYGLRGLAYMEVRLRGPNRDLHSGSYGGPVWNPGMALAQLLASMKDADGRVTIPGFYDAVLPLTQAEREEWAALPFDLERFKDDLGVAGLNGERGYSPLEQLWARPTLEVNGLLCGFTGEGAKTVLPAKAMAKVSMRLVPAQDPARIADLFEEYVRSRVPDGIQVEVRRLHGGKPWVASREHAGLVAAGRAIELAFGRKPVFQREGGSIPVVSTFSERLGAAVVLMGIGLPDENAHAPNEHLDLENFRRGTRAAAWFLAELARG
jgi:acetylornithine deacetylase/succinyl-diaminopimelate desuccinylase-like protein